MQQQIPSDQGSKLICETHKSSIEFLYFGDIGKLKSRLLCSKCIIKVVNSEHMQPSLILLNDFLLNPGNQIMQISRVNGSIISSDDGKQAEKIEEIEQLLSKFEVVVKQLIEQIRQSITSLKTWFGQDYQEVSSNLKLDDVVSLLQQLSQVDSYQGTNNLVQLEEKLNHVSENFNKCAQEKIQGNQAILFDKFANNFKTIRHEIDMFSKLSFEKLQDMVGLRMPPPYMYEEIGQFPEIHQLISEGKEIQYQLLYQGSRDGLDGDVYWSKCKDQSNLLTIMTSINGNRFGGYSACPIKHTTFDSLQKYVKDPTMKSFLFQYNKKEIYKLKRDQYHLAVFCQPNYGPTYGQFDIYIHGDFQHGSTSSLGYTYDISDHNIIDKATHIFGDKTPQLQEIKVYKVIF